MEYNPKTIIKSCGLRAALWILLMVAALSSCTTDDSSPVPSNDLSGHLRFTATVDDEWHETTRGERVEQELELSFGLYGYTYGPSDSWVDYNEEVPWMPDMLCEQEVTMIPEGWATTSLISLPSVVGTKMQFFAYYPFRDPEMASEEFQFLTSHPVWDQDLNTGTAGNPKFGFLTAERADDQLDFMVGVSTVRVRPDDTDEFYASPVKLRFKHMLAGVIFKVGEGFTEPMTINRISITNIARSGNVTVTPPIEPVTDSTLPGYDATLDPSNAAYDLQKHYGTATYTWSNLGTISTVYVEPNFQVKRINKNVANTDVGKMINGNDQVMFLIPQTISNDVNSKSKLNVTVNDNVDLSITLDSPIELKRGKITVFTISVNSLAKLQLSTSIIDWSSNEDTEFGGSAQEGNAIIPNSDINNWTDYDDGGAFTTTMQQVAPEP